MQRRRRRSNGTWFPTIGSFAGTSTEAILAGRGFSITGLANDIATTVFPVTYDVPQFKDTDTTANEGIGEILGNEYIIKRMVGKVFIGILPLIVGGEALDNAGIVTAGFFVARAGDGVVGQDAPVGGGAAGNNRDLYSPLDGDNIRQPWMWRRSWVLGTAITTAASAAATALGVYNWPPSTAGYQSAVDGPHFDIKSKRRVRQEERLWFAASYAAFPGGSVSTQVVSGYLDTRIFGQIVKAGNRSSF